MKKILFIFSIFCFTHCVSQKSQNFMEISYGSICCGTPSTEPVMNYINQFQKKNKIKTFEIYQQTGLGREGEFNLYIGTDHLSKSQKTDFIKGLESAISLQNNTRLKSREGTVSFNATTVNKTDLDKAKNVTIYKK